MSERFREVLRAQGYDDAEIDRAAKEGRLPLLVVDAVILPSKLRYSESEIIGLTGAKPPVARGLWRAMGFPDVAPDEPIFTDADVEALRTALVQIETRIYDPAPVQTATHDTRVISSALSRVAEVTTDRLADALEALRETGMSEEEIAEVIADQFELNQIERLLGYMFRRQFRAAMWRKLAVHQEQDAGDLAVGFVDIVRFTVLSRQLGPPELADLITRFESATHDTVASLGGRVVKMIGDEVMFVADDPASGVRIGLSVIEAQRSDDLLPEVRAGLAWGRALAQDGDYFGPTVNLASRIVSTARPGHFVVSDEVREALRSNTDFTWRRLPRRGLKDIGIVKLWTPRRATAQRRPEDQDATAAKESAGKS